METGFALLSGLQAPGFALIAVQCAAFTCLELQSFKNQ